MLTAQRPGIAGPRSIRAAGSPSRRTRCLPRRVVVRLRVTA
ncbi:hypothetical protein BURMUCF2_3339 [Burkholderia multivorans CF2]|nr:hypothetical protein BURMUCF2_3339 [Burkholderia multivorans CF2]